MSDVKEKILDAVDDVKEQVSLFVRDFREQTVYFKAKAAVVAGYIAVVVLSVIFLPPPGEHNPIDAVVKVGSISFGSEDRTYVFVRNDSNKTWDSATITITGTYIADSGKNAGQPVRGTWSLKERFRAHDKGKELQARLFKDKNNEPANSQVKIDEVTVDVDGVQYVKSLVKKPGG